MLEDICGVVEGIIANITPEQMDLPTVNDEWNVRELIDHLVRGNLWAVAEPGNRQAHHARRRT